MHLKTKEVFIRKMRRLSIRDPSPSKRGGHFHRFCGLYKAKEQTFQFSSSLSLYLHTPLRCWNVDVNA